MSAIPHSHPVCKEICDALGLKNVTALEFQIAIDSFITVTVTYRPEIAEVKGLVEVFKKNAFILLENGK